LKKLELQMLTQSPILKNLGTCSCTLHAQYHLQSPQEATERAKDAVRMAVAKARLMIPLQRLSAL